MTPTPACTLPDGVASTEGPAVTPNERRGAGVFTFSLIVIVVTVGQTTKESRDGP